MVNFLTLNGSIRKDLGSSNTNRLRKEGKIPAVIYGNGGKDNIYISVSQNNFNKEYLKGSIETKPMELDIDGQKYKVLTYQIDIDPVTDLPRHIDFTNIEGKTEVKVHIPIIFQNRDKSPGVKRGGFLNILKRKIQCHVDPNNIPDSISIDVGNMHIGDKLKIDMVQLPTNTKAVDKTNFNICSITGRGKSTDDAATAATADPSAVPATAVKAPANAPAAAAKAPAKPEAKK